MIMKQYQYFLFVIILFASKSYAQEGGGALDIGEAAHNGRSKFVNDKDTQGKTDWCSYTVEHEIKKFMDNNARGQAPTRNLFWSCWSPECKRSWNKTEGILESTLRASKEIQVKKLEAKKHEI